MRIKVSENQKVLRSEGRERGRMGRGGEKKLFYVISKLLLLLYKT